MRKLEIIMKVDVTETICNIERGESLEFCVSEFASIATVRNSCLRINKLRGENSLSVHSLENGTKGVIERKW